MDGARLDVTRPRFSKVASVVQIPSVDVEEAIAEDKGEPLSAEDREELAQRVADARRWLAPYAPDVYKFYVQRALPAAVNALSPGQQEVLARLAEVAEGAGARG